MKYCYGTFAGVLLVFGLCVWAADAEALFGKKDKAKTEPAMPAATAVAPSVPEGEKVVYTFSDQTKMEEFARLWQQRQRAVLRMTVLQSYWNEEQGVLQQLNDQLSKEYNLDVNKNYRFDNQRKVLVEVPAPAEAASPALAPASSQVQ